MIKYKKYQVLGKTNLKPTFVDEMGNYEPKLKKIDVSYNNYSKADNTKVNYNQSQVQSKTYPVNHKGKTVNVAINKGTITQGKSDDFKDNLYNRAKNNKTFNNLANNLIVPMTNIVGGLEGAKLVKQGVKNIVNKIPRKAPTVNNLSNNIRAYNKNFTNKPPDDYKHIVDLSKRSSAGNSETPTVRTKNKNTHKDFKYIDKYKMQKKDINENYAFFPIEMYENNFTGTPFRFNKHWNIENYPGANTPEIIKNKFNIKANQLNPKNIKLNKIGNNIPRKPNKFVDNGSEDMKSRMRNLSNYNIPSKYNQPDNYNNYINDDLEDYFNYYK